MKLLSLIAILLAIAAYVTARRGDGKKKKHHREEGNKKKKHHREEGNGNKKKKHHREEALDDAPVPAPAHHHKKHGPQRRY